MISIVIPTYNRAPHIEMVQTALKAYMSSIPQAYEVIWVDDASTDETPQILRELSWKEPDVTALILEYNAGQQNATLAGIRHASGTRVMTMDDDLRYDLKAVQKMMNLMDEGYDAVYGIPLSHGQGTIRRIGTALKEWMFRLLCGKPRNLNLSSFRIMTDEMAAWVSKDDVWKVYLSARMLRYSKDFAMVQAQNSHEASLPSNYTWMKLLGVFWHLFRNYSAPSRALGLVRKGEQYRIKECYK